MFDCNKNTFILYSFYFFRRSTDFLDDFDISIFISFFIFDCFSSNFYILLFNHICILQNHNIHSISWYHYTKIFFCTNNSNINCILYLAISYCSEISSTLLKYTCNDKKKRRKNGIKKHC